MSFLSRLFGKKENTPIARERDDEPTVYDAANDDRDMAWAIEKANLTLPYFEECLANPEPGQDVFSIKVRFDDRGYTEHIWLTEPSFDGDGNLFGVVGNNPIDVTTVKMGQRIGIDRGMISDWMIVENGWLIGGYTIRALRDNLPEEQIPQFDAGLGGIRVDVGKDYLPLSDDFPEGAVLLLEQAYNEDDLEKAMAFKSFESEAALMLAEMNGPPVTDSLVKSTAQALQASFIGHMQENGIPKIKDVVHAFPVRHYVSDDHIIVVEVCRYPDGTATFDKLHTFLVDGSWKVGGVVTEKDD